MGKTTRVTWGIPEEFLTAMAVEEMADAISELRLENERLKRDADFHQHAKANRLATLKRQNAEIKGLEAQLRQEQEAHAKTLEIIGRALATQELQTEADCA